MRFHRMSSGGALLIFQDGESNHDCVLYRGDDTVGDCFVGCGRLYSLLWRLANCRHCLASCQ